MLYPANLARRTRGGRWRWLQFLITLSQHVPMCFLHVHYVFLLCLRLAGFSPRTRTVPVVTRQLYTRPLLDLVFDARLIETILFLDSWGFGRKTLGEVPKTFERPKKTILTNQCCHGPEANSEFLSQCDLIPQCRQTQNLLFNDLPWNRGLSLL